MKKRDIIVISIVIGLTAMCLYSFPMWWGVLFSPITQQLTSSPITEELTKGFCLQTENIIFRLKGLDMLVNLFRR